jgi:hypothetical protein
VAAGTDTHTPLLEALLAILVVDGALLLVRQHLIGPGHRLERVLVSALIRMVLDRHFAVPLFDFILRGALRIGFAAARACTKVSGRTSERVSALAEAHPRVPPERRCALVLVCGCVQLISPTVCACGTYLGDAEELVEVGARFAPLFRHGQRSPSNPSAAFSSTC